MDLITLPNRGETEVEVPPWSPPAPAIAGNGTLDSALTTTVPKELVHRAALAEVFLTGWRRRTDARFTLTAQWPRSHSFFAPPSSTHHAPSLVAETIRQAVFVLAHAEFGIPLGDHFVMNELDYRTSLDGLAVGPEPAEIRLEARCSAFRRKGTKVTGFRCDLTLYRGGGAIASGGGRFATLAPRVYQRLRAGGGAGTRPPLALPAPVAPQFVGRVSPLDVCLAPTGEAHVWRLRADVTHPTMFDHPVDHVPGMVLIEAACQAASARIYPREYRALSVTSEFHRYAEFSSPCVITLECDPDDDAQVRVTGSQEGEPVYGATLRADAGDRPFSSHEALGPAD
ncbi:ScbA/BarX family gamma-butyrolactone biosynthesis protein [Streptomyces sp. 6N223]|uniref:ScbA/BarX family gamma-butyrolactone biosynthesis protein n=1 Tax=Streptomyces sp. 6N223 TaxID=3457412 RepID=UPI003FD42B08